MIRTEVNLRTLPDHKLEIGGGVALGGWIGASGLVMVGGQAEKVWWSGGYPNRFQGWGKERRVLQWMAGRVQGWWSGGYPVDRLQDWDSELEAGDSDCLSSDDTDGVSDDPVHLLKLTDWGC